MKKKSIFCFSGFVVVIFLFLLTCESKSRFKYSKESLLTDLKVDFPNTDYSSPIGVYIVDENGLLVCDNIKYNKGKDLYIPAKPTLAKLSKQNLDVYVYAPFRDDIGSTIENHQIMVSEDQSNSTNYIASDFLYAKADRNLSLNLSMKSKMSRFIINMKISESVRVENPSVEIIGLNISADINLFTGLLSNLRNEKRIKMLKTDSSTRGFNNSFEAILIPQQIRINNPMFELEIGGKVYDYIAECDLILEESMTYVWHLEIDNKGRLTGDLVEIEKVKDNISNTTNVDYIYKIGDYYPIADDHLSAVGVVFSVNSNGEHGKIVSLNQAMGLKWGPTGPVVARSYINGANNKKRITKSTDNITNYEALNWCLSKGECWYLPAINELIEIYKYKDILNRTLSPLLRSNNLEGGVYLSSTEKNNTEVMVLHFGNGRCSEEEKNTEFKVRAVCEF